MEKLIRCLKHEIEKGNLEVALNYYNAISSEIQDDDELGRLEFLFRQMDWELKSSRTYREMRKICIGINKKYKDSSDG